MILWQLRTNYEGYSESKERFGITNLYKERILIHAFERTTKILLFNIVAKQIEALIIFFFLGR